MLCWSIVNCKMIKCSSIDVLWNAKIYLHTRHNHTLHCIALHDRTVQRPGAADPLPRGIETSHVLWKPGPVWGWLTNLATLGRNLTGRRLASRRPEGCGVTAERQEMKEVWPWIGGAKLCGLGTAPARAKARRRLHTATCTHYTLWGPPDATSFEEYVRWFIYNMG